MKRNILVVFVAFFGTISANAQFYLSGSVGVNISSSKGGGEETMSTKSFSITPELGYILNEKVDVGIAVHFLSGKEKDMADEIQYSELGVVPFVRYSLIHFGKLNVLGRAGIFAYSENTKNSNDPKIKDFSFGLNVNPVLEYDLSDRFTLYTDLNFMGINFSRSNSKIDNNIMSTTGFNFNINTDNVLSAENFTIGISYNF